MMTRPTIILAMVVFAVLCHASLALHKAPSSAQSNRAALNPTAAGAVSGAVKPSHTLQIEHSKQRPAAVASSEQKPPAGSAASDAQPLAPNQPAEEATEAVEEDGGAESEDAEEASEEGGDDVDSVSLSQLQKDVFTTDQEDPFEREMDNEDNRLTAEALQRRAQWQKEDDQMKHTEKVSKQSESNAGEGEADRRAASLVFESTINHLKAEHAVNREELTRAQEADGEILASLKTRLARNMRDGTREPDVDAAVQAHPAVHRHRFSGNSSDSDNRQDWDLTRAQIARAEMQKIHRERTVAYYDARHIRGGSIGALKRAKRSFLAAQLAFEGIQEVEHDDPENFGRYKKKLAVATRNLEDAKALRQRAYENVAEKARLLQRASHMLAEAKLQAACDDHPCKDPSTACVPDPKARKLRRCPNACYDFDQTACGPDGKCVGINHKPVCVPVCTDDFCSSETLNTRCASIKRKPVCVNPCEYFKGDDVCDKIGGLKCVPSHNATNYFIRCKDLCTDSFCAKESVEVKCEMIKGKPTCVDPCFGVKCHGSEACVRVREDRPDIGDRSRFLVSGVCKPLCPDDGPNPCAQFASTSGRTRCLAVKNQRYCVDPCFNVTDCPKGTQCARQPGSADKHVCKKLCPRNAEDGEYPCPPKFAHLQNNTKCEVTEEGHDFRCVNPCKEVDGGNPCPISFACTPLLASPSSLAAKVYHSCAPACTLDSCTEEPNTLCRAPGHEPICTQPCVAAAKDDCHLKGATIGCVPYVRKTEKDAPYLCVDMCKDGGPCRTRKSLTQCFRNDAGVAECRNPCKTGAEDPCDVEQVCVPNGRAPKGYKCVMACTQHPCPHKDDVCVSDNTVPIVKRRCVQYPSSQ